jgi:hypothetical protein
MLVSDDWAHETLYLLNVRGIEVNSERGETHEPAIYIAVRYDHSESLRELLRLGANTISEAGEHGSVLHTVLVRD